MGSERILFYINLIDCGGAERVITTLANSFSEHGYHVFFVTTRKSINEYSLNSDIRRFNLEKRPYGFLYRNLKRIIRLRNIIKKTKPDFVISFTPEASIRAIISTIGVDTKVVMSIRNDVNVMMNDESFGKVFVNFISRFAAGCVFQTEEQAFFFPKKIRNRSVIILNPVNDTFFGIKRNPESGLVVNCGRLELSKNQRMLISAFSRVVQVCPNARLEIFGTGELKDELQAQIEHLGLSKYVYLKGQKDSIESVLSRAEVFAFSSDHEGMPNALLEALVVGVPAVSTDFAGGACKMIIKDKVNGMIVPRSDVRAMSDTIIRLLNDKYLRERLSKNSVELSKQYSEECIFRLWEDYLKKMSM